MELSTLAIVWLLFRGLTSIIPLLALRKLNLSSYTIKINVIIIALLTLSTIFETIIINSMGWIGLVCALVLELITVIAVYYSLYLFIEKVSNVSNNIENKLWEIFTEIFNNNEEKEENEKVPIPNKDDIKIILNKIHFCESLNYDEMMKLTMEYNIFRIRFKFSTTDESIHHGIFDTKDRRLTPIHSKESYEYYEHYYISKEEYVIIHVTSLTKDPDILDKMPWKKFYVLPFKNKVSR